MTLHHVGIVVDSIETHAKRYEESFGMKPLTGVILDPIQKVNVQFLGDGAGGRASVELIEPLPGDSPVRRALEKGGGLNHLCYEVPDIDAAVCQAQAQRALCVRTPVPATAFDGRRIAFMFYRGMGLIEFVEAPAK